MLPYGSDRSRMAGGKVILQSRLSKGWTARTAKTSTRGARPGTTVLWSDEYFEVVAADALQDGGVRYVLAPWPENEAIRVFERYDEESEARRIADHEAARRQRQQSFVTRLSGMFIGHLPAVVQNKLGDALGISPSRMTLVSIIPSMIFIVISLSLAVGATVNQRPSGVPLWVLFLAGYMFLDSVVRFQIVMSQSRAVGSFPGLLVYLVVWLLAPKRKRLVSPFAVERGQSSSFTIAPPDDVALRDSVETRGVMLALLTPAEQQRLADRVGFDYRKFAPGTAWIFLCGSVIGLVSSLVKVAENGSISAGVSAALAAVIAVEQVIRLQAFRRGPAGSMFGALVRPFVRDLLQR